MFHLRSIRLSCAAACALLAAGCSNLGFGVDGPAPVDEAPQFAPVDYSNVCLLLNNKVQSRPLVDAIVDGVKAAGANVRKLPDGSGPEACPFVITYGVETNENVVRPIIYQTYENGIPRVEARGAAPEGKGLTVQLVRNFTAELLTKLREAQKQAAAK